MLSGFKEKLKAKNLRNLRLLNVTASAIVTILGFIFEFAYHDGIILLSGLLCSMVLISNYLLSFYSSFYRKHFTNLTYAAIFLLHFWATYVGFVRNFEIGILLPLSISTFTFSLIFDRFIKSLVFIFTVSTGMAVLMLSLDVWQPEYTITLIALFSGAFLTEEILKRRASFYNEILNQERRYTALAENMNDGLLYLNNDLQIIFVNDRFCSITGYTKEEVLGMSGQEFPPFLTGDLKTLPPKDTIVDEPLHNESIMKRKGGEIRWVRTTESIHFESGKAIGRLIVFTDITTLKKTQDELKKREEGYRTFIDQSAVGIWRADYIKPISTALPVERQVDLLLDTGIISECNDFMAGMYGYSGSSELIGRRIRDFYHIENNLDDEKSRSLMKTFIENGYRISNAESKELDRNGIVRYMLNNNIGIIENGSLIRTWGVQTDITDRKRTEKELLESNQELDTFFYKASHDLKGPLASVMGIVNLARLEQPDAIMDHYFELIEKSIKRLDQTLIDLIELARTRKGSSKLSHINLHTLVEEILGSLNHTPDYHRIQFIIYIDPEAEIVTDRVLIRSVLQNLIHNAINYCNPANPTVQITITDNDQGYSIEITDNGPGIPDAVKSRVFEMFYRGNTESTGSGLGLYIVKNALEKMKGSIELKSIVGEGTTFTVCIPNAAVEA